MLNIIQQAKALGFDMLVVLAGLGLFIFGINSIGDELKSLAGTRLKTIIDRYTTNKIKGIFVGIVVTALIQSSSATTALVIGLVRSGLMTLNQALGVIMGSNIGTTITAILIGFNLSKIAPYALMFGAFMELFSKSKKTKNYARLIVSFGMLFFGLEMMGNGLKVLAELPVFGQFATSLAHNKFYGILVGIVMTLIIQSSSATIGILQTLYGQGMLSLSASLPILLGDNIGTTITAVLASLGGSPDAKKAALSHVLIKTVGTVVFMLAFPLYLSSVEYFSALLALNKMMELALAHFIFNIINTVLLFPFINQLEKLVNFIIKSDEIEVVTVSTIFEKAIIKESPVMALGIALNGTLEMSEHCLDIFDLTRCYIETGENKCYQKALEHEEMVNLLNRNLSEYLVEISGHQLSDDNNVYLNFLMYSIKDLERIGDHLLNIDVHFESIFLQEEQLSEAGSEELNELMDLIAELLKDLHAVIESPSRYLIDRLYGLEDKINASEQAARFAFINRLKDRVPMGSLTMALYVDILSDFERVGDYAYNIARRLKESVFNLK